MKKRLVSLLLATIVVSGVAACATPPLVSGSVDSPPSTEAARAPSDPTTLMVRGTIGNYDAPTQILSLSTSHGTIQFPVPSVARIRLNGHPVAACELDNLRGHPATVRYSESSGARTVESVHVLERAKG